jgi:SAM-dependent methyltransferase
MKKEDQISYDRKLGRWWLAHSMDGAHKRAYQNIADFIRASFVHEPALIVDYACGPGNLLALLSSRFQHSKLTGVDGSAFMLDLARSRASGLPAEHSKRISFIETELPNPDVLPGEADLVIYCFPNMIPFSREDADTGKWNRLSPDDRKIARSLLTACTPDDEAGPTAVYVSNLNALEMGRCVSQNLRQMLVKDGVCVRIEYATAQRHELSPEELEFVAFEEGSLDAKVDGRTPRLWFRLLASAFYRSRVLEDVYEQTGDKRDMSGGYLITVLRAI